MANESGWTRIPMIHPPANTAARAARAHNWIRVPRRSRSPIGRRLVLPKTDSLAMASALKAHVLAQAALTDELLIILQ